MPPPAARRCRTAWTWWLGIEKGGAEAQSYSWHCADVSGDVVSNGVTVDAVRAEMSIDAVSAFADRAHRGVKMRF